MFETIEMNLILSGKKYIQQRDYWIKKLNGIEFECGLNNLRKENINELSTNCYKITYEGQMVKRIVNICKGQDLSIYIFLLTGVKLLLYKLTGYNNSVISSPVYNEYKSRETLNSYVVVQNLFEERNSFKELIVGTKNSVLKAYENQDYPLEKVFDYLNFDREHGAFLPSDIICLLENIHEKTDIRRLPKNGLVFAFNKKDSSLSLEIMYNSCVYESQLINRLGIYLNNIFEQVCKNVNILISEMDILPKEEINKILFSFNDSYFEFLNCKNICQAFEKQVKKAPNSIAVAYENNSLTYMELNCRADCLAYELVEKGVVPNDVIALMVERSVEMIIGILGIIKAGAGYLPINHGYPEERIKYMLKDSGTKILVTQEHLTKLVHYPVEIVLVNDKSTINDKQFICHFQIGLGNLAYVIYTSGSTGNPKGVMISHGCVLNLVNGLYEIIYRNYGSNLNVALVAPFIFDASVQQIFASLILGHTLHIVPKELRVDGEKLLNFYVNKKIELSDGTPMHLSMLIKCNQSLYSKAQVKHFIIGGEALQSKVAREFLNKFGENKPSLTNIYGPTECCVDSTSFLVNCDYLEKSLDVLPIGKPLANQRVYILNENMDMLPIGVAGDLFIGGDGVGKGYLNLHNLMQEKFISDKYYPESVMYKTGDRARWLSDGNIEFLGRIDNQVKLNGYRIELGEIENKLLQINNIVEAVVLINENTYGDKYLSAFLVSDESLDISNLRNHLRKELPEYMVPKSFVQIEKMPITTNGKVDREKLLELKPSLDFNVECIKPRNTAEEIIADVWKNVFNIEQMGINYNFFEIGGDSLKALRVIVESEKYGIRVSMSDIFKYQTIENIYDNVFSGNETNNLIKDLKMAQEAITNYIKDDVVFERYLIGNKEYFVLLLDGYEHKFVTLKKFIIDNLAEEIYPHYIGSKDKGWLDSLNSNIINNSYDTVLNYVISTFEKQDAAFNEQVLNEPSEKKYPVAPIQRGFLEYSDNFSGSIFSLDGYYDISLLEKAFLQLLNMQGLMRSVLVRDGETLYWQEFKTQSSITIPYINISHMPHAIQELLIKQTISYCFYKNYEKYNNLLYRILIIQRNLRELLILMPFNHSIFDGMSSDIIEKNLKEYYNGNFYKNIVAKSNANFESYDEYVGLVKKGPQGITEEDIIKIFRLGEFKKYSDKVSKCLSTQNINGDLIYEVQDENILGLKEKGKMWEVSLELFTRVCAKYINLDIIPMVMFHYGRRYKGKAFFNTVGEFIDLMPVIVDRSSNYKNGISEYIQSLINIASKHNVNFAALNYDADIRRKYKKTAELLETSKMPLLLFNYHGEVELGKVDFFNTLNHSEKVAIRNVKTFPSILFEVVHTDKIFRISMKHNLNVPNEELCKFISIELKSLVKLFENV